MVIAEPTPALMIKPTPKPKPEPILKPNPDPTNPDPIWRRTSGSTTSVDGAFRPMQQPNAKPKPNPNPTPKPTLQT